ncbi:uncharacterized protein LOC122060959 [Macadamia integrifolia]|uniref:uncharacterized protein LOC122060959 n=1 Tax=Macadamia integrifolia TaxID=60698 RepID=UPI001C534099|nr:uncharacterized protein LOC122060959 [Macadamia integrifolia]
MEQKNNKIDLGVQVNKLKMKKKGSKKHYQAALIHACNQYAEGESSPEMLKGEVDFPIDDDGPSNDQEQQGLDDIGESKELFFDGGEDQVDDIHRNDGPSNEHEEKNVDISDKELTELNEKEKPPLNEEVEKISKIRNFDLNEFPKDDDE